ncbi:hypothetical protein [Paenibacillus sp. FSL R5-0908]|uniref:hypothetical protein n=1 Tax=Paenibacillus sp. FSL R5-0908 TaxID=2921664 RepID=UPI0030FBD779
MAKGVRLVPGEKAEVYSTKILPTFKLLLGAQAMVLGPKTGQRELLEEMHKAYIAAYPERAAKALELLSLVDPQAVAAVSAYLEITPAAAPVVVEQVEQPRLVQTVRYIGRPQVHLYEPGRKNGTGCSLAGAIDPDTIGEQSPDAVDCKKCRYCRKAVFAN